MHGLMQQRPLTVTDLVTRVESNFAEKRIVTATATGETGSTWHEVAQRARNLAGVLDALDCPSGSRVATLGWNSQRHVELYLAAPASGRVLHTLNHRLHTEELAYIAEHAADDVLFVDRTLVGTLEPLLGRLDTVRHIVVMDDGGDHALPADPRVADYEELLHQGNPHPLDAVTDEEEAAGLCYTSGTTGRPKGVLYSHRSIVLHALMLLGVDSFAISERDVVMPIVPMFHVNAWGLPYAAMLAGSDLVLPGPAMAPQSLLAQMQRHRVTFAAGVPTLWHGMQPHLDGVDLTSLRLIICGGGAVPDSLSEAWMRATGIPLTNAWGMTETSPVVTSSRLDRSHDDLDPDAKRRLLATPGPNLPLAHIRVVDDAGRPVERDGVTPGELQAAGPTIAAAYFGDAAAAAFTDDGWLRTGDVATIDRTGRLRIVDRTKDLVKSGGEWISSIELENEIMAHPDVREAAVIAVPDDRWGERPLAWIVPVPGRAVDPAGLRDFLTGRVASWWLPESIQVVDEIPKTSTGKFSKTTLRSMLPADEPANHRERDQIGTA